MHRVRIPSASPVVAHRVRPVRAERPVATPTHPSTHPNGGRGGRSGRRAWRRRSRRGQVSAIVTLFGLLLVVTFIGNYLTNTLPGQMESNDLSHGLLVENQVGRLASLLARAASSGSPGDQFTQPISLGSSGEPPFAAPDSSTLSAGPNGSGITVSFTATGPTTYNPPQGYPEGGSASACSLSPSSDPSTITCDTSSKAAYNFAGNGRTFTGSLESSGALSLNYSTNSSVINLALTGSGAGTVQIFGSHDTIRLTGIGSGPDSILIVGNYDTTSVNTTGSQSIRLTIVGNYDPVSAPTASGSGGVTLVITGTHDHASLPAVSGSGSVGVYFTGFNGSNPSASKCPVANLSSTDGVTGANITGSGSIKVYLNNSVGYSHTATNSSSGGGWTTTWQSVTTSTCPYFSALSEPYKNSGPIGGSFIVHLDNLYAPTADVAFDSGAVVSAQSGGIPVMVDPPPISYAFNALDISIPLFQGQFGGAGGTTTTVLAFSLVSSNTISLPGGGYSLSTSVNVTLTSPFASAWMTYFCSQSAFNTHANYTGPAGHATCSSSSAPYDQPFKYGGPLGTVSLLVPATALRLTLATFQVEIL